VFTDKGLYISKEPNKYENMDQMMNKYRFRNVVLEEKPKTMDNVLSSIHFYLPHRRQQHLLKFRSLCFSQSACPKPKDARLDCGWL